MLNGRRTCICTDHSNMQPDPRNCVGLCQSYSSRRGVRVLGGSARTMGPNSGDPSKTSLCPIMPQEHTLGHATREKVPGTCVWVDR